MSKIIDKYNYLKSKDKSKLYLFKSGKFYIFIDDDCSVINEYVPLKKVLLSNNIYKCGFPDSALSEYLRVFNNHKLNVEIVSDLEFTCSQDDVFNKIKSIDINRCID